MKAVKLKLHESLPYPTMRTRHRVPPGTVRCWETNSIRALLNLSESKTGLITKMKKGGIDNRLIEGCVSCSEERWQSRRLN